MVARDGTGRERLGGVVYSMPSECGSSNVTTDGTETPENVFQHCSANFKGPISGEYYLRVLIDNLSRYPVVQIVKSTGFSDLKPKLDDTFGMFGVPESITHDGGPPYNSGEWKRYAREQGLSRGCALRSTWKVMA